MLKLLTYVSVAILLLVVLDYEQDDEVPPTVAELREDPVLLERTRRDCARRRYELLSEKVYPSQRCVNALEALARGPAD